ncbi:PaaX family transcriptional regulator C-terminal domain-containing protein [Paenibacillus pedocola]|uniref:PaaX family transcriptional regulator C-terminal domain-containing protein n=1 Tax=Paenibacillus pedocola TaxID=3242193 RepID=UPI002877261F|nr:PaaX family transcriptional regulator C-terminal domain-containing protein [Paenibacillus typhae]
MLSVEKTMLFLLSRVDQMGAQQFVEIYEQRGYTSTYIRNSLSRLKKEGYIASPSRSIYQITTSGRSYIKSINSKPARYHQTWDHTWDVVMLEVPEHERKKRDAFRAAILQLGFGLLYNSVYISPWNYRQEVTEYIQSLGLTGNVSILRGEFAEGSITPAKAWTIWQLDKVEAVYQDKWSWSQTEFAPLVDEAVRDGQALRLFLLYLQIGEVLSGLFMVDPSLPDELLPADWSGKTVLAELQAQSRRLAEAIPRDSFYALFT